MEEEYKPKDENHTITWGKAILYAFGWLICWSLFAVPIIVYSIFVENFIICFLGSILPLLGVMAMATSLHYSWRVSIALLIEIVIVSGSLILIILNELTSGLGFWM